MSNSTGIIATPRTVDIELTPRCNLRCSYCYYFNNPGESYKELSTKEWLDFFDELGRNCVMNVTLSGGEPFIRKDLKELLSGIVKNQMRFTLLSNGGLIDDDIASYIALTGRCDQIQISIDGSSADVHDSCRGQGSFNGAVRGIRILQKHGISVTVRMTLHHKNVDDIEATSDFLLNTLNLPSFSVNAASYLGAFRERKDEIGLSLTDRYKAMHALLKARDKHCGRINAQAGPLADADTWRKMEEARISGTPAFPKGGKLTGCGCVFNRMAIRTDGSMVPCMLLPHLVLGMISKDSLQDIWQHSDILAAMRDRNTISLENSKYCKGCPYIPYCTGNCPATAYTITGDVYSPSPDSCLRDYLADGGLLP